MHNPIYLFPTQEAENCPINVSLTISWPPKQKQKIVFIIALGLLFFFFNLKEFTFSHSTESSLFITTKALQILWCENNNTLFCSQKFPLIHFYCNCTKSQTGVAFLNFFVSFPNPSCRIYSCCLSQYMYVENLKVLLTGSLLYNGS